MTIAHVFCAYVCIVVVCVDQAEEGKNPPPLNYSLNPLALSSPGRAAFFGESRARHAICFGRRMVDMFERSVDSSSFSSCETVCLIYFVFVNLT